MDGEITTLYTLSATAPDLPVDRELIPRDVELNQIEEKLKNNTVVFVDGEEGIGVTTLLALFAHRHHFNCISYFYNGLVRTEAKPEFIKQSLSEQLHFYINKTTESEHELTWENLYAATLKKISSNKKHPLFFVFDGINFIPQEYREQIIQLFSTLPLNKAKFIFSGKDDDFKWLIQKKISSTSANQLLEFSKESCEKYLKNNIDNISEEDINELYQITRGVGKNISYILHKYKELNDIAPLLNKKDELLKDLYSMEIEHIRNLDDEQVYNLLCFITYCETKVTKDLLMAFMSINESNLNVLLQKIDRYLTINDDYISYKMPEFHKYMKTQLKNKEQDTLVQILKVYEKNITKYNDSILNLYNRSNQNENIITYLKSENVQHILEEERSHASYSLQCDYGFNAANKISGGKQNDKNIYICDAFRFAVSKSASREIEHNELWDFEIEALMANGEVEKAYTYAKSIYLVEEKLKNLILIVKEKQKLSKNMRDEILTEIKILIDFIKFEDIPEKSIELAKLLLSVDFTLSMTIIDKLIQHSQNKNFADKIYTIMSLSMDITKSDDDYNIAKYDDAFQSKIEDEGIRRMTNAMKSIFGNNSATEVISKINELSSSSQKIIFLQNWIPTHTDNKGIDQVIEYAIKLVISDSTIEVPKASVISEFTKALPNVSTKESFDKILLLINSVEDTIKTPTLDYTLIQLHIIESLSKFDSVKAYEILDDLYLNIDNLSDSSIKIDCLSLLLSHYKKLGINEEIEKKFITNTVLLAQIRNLIVSELTKTAYHYKLVETAIKTLVCKYHQFIHEIIPMLNTEYARSKAFLLAAIEYIKQIKLKDFDWDYLNSLIACIKVSTKDIDKPLVILAQKIHQSDYSDVLANKVKANFSNLFDKIHLDGNKCVVMAHLYIWFFKSDKHYSEFIFKKLYDIWQQLPYLWVKIGLGYQFATIFAKVDSQTSNQILHETFRISEGYIFSSTSNLYAYLESFDLYARSIGLLIRIGDCSDDVLKKFEIVMNKFKCNLFELSYWSRIALEYYIRKDAENFKKIFGSKVHEEYDKLQISDYNKQTLLLDVAPAFFLYSKDIFVDELKKQNDLFFQNSCINKICNFIFFKHPYIGDDDFRNCYFDLNDEDLENIFVLLDLCTDDALFLSIIETVCKSIDKNKGSLPIAQKKYRINKLKEIVNRKLPIKPNGIIHEGYKIACNAVIDSLTLNNKRATWEKYIVDIETISNDADKAFLYFYISEFITNKDKQTEFIEKGFNLSNSLTSGYDKFSRFEMCLNECLVARDKMREYISKIGNAFKQSKQIDYSNNEHLIDIAYKHSEQMANLFIDILDQDEARRCHKAPILRHYDSLKRIEQANKDIKHIVKLKQNETIQFFSTQYNNLLNKKAIILDFYETAAVLKPIFDNNITVSKSAILYFMENTYQRHKISKNMNSTIWSIYESLVFNLNMVMALSTNTQDNLKMINCTMSRNFASNNSVIHPGERDKGLLYILDWFKDNQGSVLRIIDPYFSPKDIIELKPLFDIENRLNIKILTHAKVQELADYKEAWNNTYSNLTGSIDIITVCDKSKPDDGPLHDRYWIVSDRRKKLKAGLKLNSMSGLGNKEGDIERIPDEKIESIEDMWAYYYEDNISSINNKELKYSKIFIESEP